MSDKNNSGLEVVAHRVRQSAADEWEFMHGTPMNCKIVEPLVRLSDAEAALLSAVSESRAESFGKLTDLNAELVEALRKIAAIDNKEFGSDWEEIEEARGIANAALLKAEGAKS